jgi:hypothetical protein
MKLQVPFKKKKKKEEGERKEKRKRKGKERERREIREREAVADVAVGEWYYGFLLLSSVYICFSKLSCCNA